jgi:hypothetical protein
MFPWQQIDAGSDELFEMVINIQFTSKLKEKLQSAPVHHEFTTGFRRVLLQLRRELVQKTRLSFMCNRFVK